MADPLLIQSLQRRVRNAQWRIDSLQASLNDPEISPARKQIAQRNLVNANADLAVAQADAQEAQAQNEPAKDVVTDTDVPPATTPNLPASEAVTNTTATKTDTPAVDENIPGYGTAPLTAPSIGASDPASQLAQADAAANVNENIPGYGTAPILPPPVSYSDPASQLAAEDAANNPNENIPGYGTAPTNPSPLAGDEDTGGGKIQPSFPNPLVTATPDWRVRISLAGGKYLYDAAKDSSNILFPLKATSGVVFPYTPTIQTAYRANYEGSDITHANYKQYFYKNSSVEEITITGEFTAQDNAEAQYVLAVIHFFKSVTKMFYGKDTDPVPGTPPPLCFLNGYGPYQFNDHPILISNFQYSLPNDVDYVRTEGTALSSASASNDAPLESKLSSLLSSVTNRLKGNNLQKGGTSPQPKFNNLAKPDATYVPSKITITITAIPIVTRNDISKNFSVADYASGKLLLGNTRNPKGGIW